MQTLWPWLAVAGLGALHGLSPANGWMFAAACGVHSRDSAQARRALLPIAIGHAASIAVVVGAIALGMRMDRALLQGLAGALLVGVAMHRLLRDGARHTSCTTCAARARIVSRMTARTSHAGIALWSCLMASAHGAGLMLVPALVPLCMADTPAGEITASGSLLLASAAFGLHMAAMLVTTGVIASGVCRGMSMHPRLLDGAALHQVWTAALAVTGLLLLTRS